MLGKTCRKILYLASVQIVLCFMVLFRPAVYAESAKSSLTDEAKRYLKENTTFRDKFYDASAINDKAWRVGYNGVILHLSENLTCFEKQDSGTLLPLFSVSFIDKNRGVLFGKQGIILRTGNGGKDGSAILAGGHGRILRSEGGKDKRKWMILN